MDIKELYDKLKQAWNEETGEFLITGKGLESEAVSKLLRNFMGSDKLQLLQADKPGLKENKVEIVSARVPGPFMNLKGCVAGCEFYLDEENRVQVTVDIHNKTTDYKLSTSYTSIANTTASYIKLKEPHFILQSTYEEGNYKELEHLQEKFARHNYHREYDDRIKKGLYFTATLTIEESLDWVAEFLSGKTMKLSGPIQLIDDVPRMRLRTEVLEKSFGSIKGATGFDIIGLFNAGIKDQIVSFSTISVSRLYGELEFTDSPVPKIPIYAMLPVQNPGMISVESELGEVSRYGLSNFAALLGGKSPDGALPDDFPGITDVALERVSVEIHTKSLKPYSLSAEFSIAKEHRLPLLSNEFSLGDIHLNFAVYNPFEDHVTLNAEARGSLFFNSQAAVGRIDTTLGFYGGTLGFNSSLANGSYVSLTQFVKGLVPDLPDLPEVAVTGLSIGGEKTGQNVKFHFEGELGSDLTISLGLFDVKLTQVGLGFSYESGSVPDKSLRLMGVMELGEKTEVFVKAGVSGKAWFFEGGLSFEKGISLGELLPEKLQIIPREVLDVRLDSVAVALDSGKKSLELTVKAQSHLEFSGLGRLAYRELKVKVAKTEKGYEWSVELQGGLQLAELETGTEKSWLLDMVGTLTIEAKTGDKEYSLHFKPDEGSGTMSGIPLLLPYRFLPEGGVEWSEMKFTLDLLKIQYKSSQWSFDADFQLQFTKLIPELKMVLPEAGLKVGLHIAGDESWIVWKDEVIDYEIPSITLPAVGESVEPFKTGKARFKLGDMKLVISGKSVGVKATLSYYLPENLNKLFGTEASGSGEPKIKLFDTYDPQARDKVKPLSITFKAGMTSGKVSAGISLTHIPISVLSEADKDHWALEFGPESDPGKYGSIWFKKPVLEINMSKGGFEAKAGFKIKKDPAIPLDLLKTLLKAGNLKKVAENLPETLPIPLSNPPQFISGTGDDRKLEWKRLETFIGIEWPPALRDMIEAISGKVKRMPESFTEYLNPKIPKEFDVEIAMKPGGSFEFGLRAEPGIRLLMVQPMPSLMIPAFELRGFSIGSYFSGQLFSVRVDADFDTFDLPTLVASVFMDESWDKYLGNPAKFRRRLSVHDLLIFIIWQTQVPIPVPAFYKKLAIDYYGLGDITVESSFEFPEPSLDLKEAGGMLKDLVKFFSDPKFRLNPNQQYENFNLRFTVGPNYISTGKYLGKKVLGLKEGLPVISAYQLMAYILNGIKFFDIVELMQSIPLKYRHGKGEVMSDFMGITVQGAYLAVSPYEFLALNGYQKLDLDAEGANALMTILPSPEGKPITKDDKGLILFAKGKWKTEYTSFDVAFGLVALDSKRFNTGFLLNGTVAELFDVHLLATLQIDPPEHPFALKGRGKTHFQVLGHTLFSGEINASANQEALQIEGVFDLLPGNELFSLRTVRPISGKVTSDDLAISGEIEGRFAMFALRGSLDMDKTGIDMSLKFLSAETTFILTESTVQYKGKPHNAVVTNGEAKIGWAALKTNVSVIPETAVIALFTADLAEGFIRVRSYFEADIQASRIGARGTLDVWIAEAINPKPVFSQETEIDEQGLRFNGSFNLLPEGSPINWNGYMSGRISTDRFELKGDSTIKVGSVELKGNIDVDSESISGQVNGQVFIYLAAFNYTLGLKEDEVDMGRVNISLLGLTAIDGTALISNDRRQIKLLGAFNLLELGELIYIRSTANFDGGLSVDRFSLGGGIKGKLLIFSAEGTAVLGAEEIKLSLTILGRKVGFSIKVEASHLEMKGNIPVAFTDYSSTTRIYPVTQELSTELKSSTIAGLLDMELNFKAAFNGAANGRFSLYLLRFINGNPVINADVRLHADHFSIDADFQLLPAGSPFNISGHVKGDINANGFRLTGNTTLSIAGIPGLTGSITFSERGISGQASNSFTGTLDYSVVVCGQTLYLCGKWTWARKTSSFYMDNSFPYLHVGECPCRHFNSLMAKEGEASPQGMLARLYESTNRLFFGLVLELGLAVNALEKSDMRVTKGQLISTFEPDVHHQGKVHITEVNENLLTSVYTGTINREDEAPGFFADIGNAIEGRTRTRLNMKNASVSFTYIPANPMAEGKVTLTFPEEKRAFLGQIELEISMARSKRFVPELVAYVKKHS